MRFFVYEKRKAAIAKSFNTPNSESTDDIENWRLQINRVLPFVLLDLLISDSNLEYRKFWILVFALQISKLWILPYFRTFREILKYL